jgi:hypothetical protein
MISVLNDFFFFSKSNHNIIFAIGKNEFKFKSIVKNNELNINVELICNHTKIALEKY